MKAKLTKPADSEHGVLPTGTTIEHPDAWLLCIIFDAEPADDECRARLAQDLQERKAREERKKQLAEVKGQGSGVRGQGSDAKITLPD
jgi:hypothetical protein